MGSKKRCKTQLEITTERVEKLLRANFQARCSDKTLILDYLFRFTKLKGLSEMAKTKIRKAVFVDAPPFETITRVRRRLQEDGQYSPSDAVKKGRKDLEKANRIRWR